MSDLSAQSPASSAVTKPYILHKNLRVLTDNERGRITRLHDAFDFLETKVSAFEDAVLLAEECSVRRNAFKAQYDALRASDALFGEPQRKVLGSLRRMSSWQRMASASASQDAFDIQEVLKLITSLSFEPISGIGTPIRKLLGLASDTLKIAVGDARPIRNAASHVFELNFSPEKHAVTVAAGGMILSSGNLAGSEFQSSWKGTDHALRVDADTLKLLVQTRDYVFAAFQPMVDSAQALMRKQIGAPPQEPS